MCVVLPDGASPAAQEPEAASHRPKHTTQTHSVPVFEEASETEGDEFEYGFQHERGGEKIVAVLEDEIQGLKREC